MRAKKQLRSIAYGSKIKNFDGAERTESARPGISKEDVMVSLTDGAVNKFKEVVAQQGSAGDGVRIFVVPGG